MKKHTVLIVLVLCMGFFQVALGQGSVNVRIQGGYSMGTSKSLVDRAYTEDNQGQVTSVEDIYHSLGKGINFRAALGIPVSPNIEVNFESGLSLSNGTSWEENFGAQKVEYEITARHIPLLFTVIASAGLNGAKPYAGAGTGLYLYSITMKETAGQAVFETKERVKLPIGFHGLVGIELPTGNNITFFGEIRFVSLSLLRSETEVTEARDSNGNDVLNQIDIDPFTDGNQKIVEYEKDNKDKFPPESFPASNIGVMIGAKISL